jgi:hypothetical protein
MMGTQREGYRGAEAGQGGAAAGGDAKKLNRLVEHAARAAPGATLAHRCVVSFKINELSTLRPGFPCVDSSGGSA